MGTLEDLEREIRKLFELTQLAGQSAFIEAKLPHIISHLEDVETGLDQTLASQRRDERDYFIPRWLGDLYRGLRETKRVYARCNAENLDALQQKGINLETLVDDATQRIIDAIKTYTKAEVDKALVVIEAKHRQKEDELEQPPQEAVTIKRSNYTSRVLRLFVEEGREEVSSANLMSPPLIPEYTNPTKYSKLLVNMRTEGLIETSRKEGRRTFYRVTEKGRQHYQKNKSRS